jgi:hypothetical protein
LATEQIKIRSSQQIRFSWGKIAGEKAEGHIARGKAGGELGKTAREKAGKNKLSRTYLKECAGEWELESTI